MLMKNFLLKILFKKYKPHLITVFGNYGCPEAREAIHCVLAKHYLTFAAPCNNFWSFFYQNFSIARLLHTFINKDSFPRFFIIDVSSNSSEYISLKRLLPVRLAVVMPTGDIPSGIEEVFAGPQEDLFYAHADIGSAARGGVFLHDDETARELSDKIQTNAKTFGFDEHANIRIMDYEPNLSIHTGGVEGSTVVDFQYGKTREKVILKNAFGKRNVYAAGAALVTALQFGIDFKTASQDLAEYIPPKYALQLMEGIKRTALFYHIGNVSPNSARESVELLGRMRKERRIQRALILLSDIITHQDSEYFEGLHRTLGELAVKNSDVLFLAGERIIFTEDEAQKRGMPRENIQRFNDVLHAARAVQDTIDTGDAVLILGSSELHLEQAIEELRQT